MHPYINLGSFSISTFQLFSIFSFILCSIVFLMSQKYDKLFVASIIRVIPITIISTVLLGKTLYLVTAILSKKPLGIEWINGFVFFGGLYGAFCGLFFYCKKNHMRYLDYTDLITSLLPLAQGCGRIGCYFNGCCYGIQTECLISVKYLVNNQQVNVFPTWFFESAFCLFLFFFFFMISKRKKSGFYTSIYLIVYSSFRFFIEFFRGDVNRGIYFGISTSQIICVVSIAVGVKLLIYITKSVRMNLIIVGRGKNESK